MKLIDYPEAKTWEGYCALLEKARFAFHKFLRNQPLAEFEEELSRDYQEEMGALIFECEVFDLASDVKRISDKILTR